MTLYRSFVELNRALQKLATVKTRTTAALMLFTLLALSNCSTVRPFEMTGTEHMSCSPELRIADMNVDCMQNTAQGSFSYNCKINGVIENIGAGIADNVFVKLEYGGTLRGIRSSTYNLLGNIPPDTSAVFETEFNHYEDPISYDIWVECNEYKTVEPSATSTSVVKIQPLLPASPEEKPPAIVTRGHPLQIPRNLHTATILPNGKILLAGGSLEPDDFIFDEELFDPITGLSSWTAPLHTPRHGHTATLLRDGRVLVVGGYSLPQQWLRDAEIFDPVRNTWTVVPPLFPHGTVHTATLLQDGRVLVVGGCIGSGVCTEKVEIFDPESDSWSEAMPLEIDRGTHTAQLLNDGRVLIAGGEGASGILNAAPDGLIYNPNTDSWTATGAMLTSRILAESVLLSNGTVFVVGGILLDEPANRAILASSEIYNPINNSWMPAADLSEARYAFNLVLLPNGHVLAIGGARNWDCCWTEYSFVGELESYDPVQNQWITLDFLPQPTAHATSILLPNGTVWVAGGQSENSGRLFPAETWIIAEIK